jgi:hypothetical protein
MKLKINFMGRLQGSKAGPCLLSDVTGASPNPLRFYALPLAHTARRSTATICVIDTVLSNVSEEQFLPQPRALSTRSLLSDTIVTPLKTRGDTEGGASAKAGMQ